MGAELQASLWGALLGAATGGLVSFFSEWLHESRRRHLALIDQFADLASEFDADVHTYWSSVGVDLALQSRIISGHHKIRTKLVQLGFDLVNNVEIRRLVKELFQFASGGSFATKAHAPDPNRPREVSRRLERLEVILSSGIRNRRLYK